MYDFHDKLSERDRLRRDHHVRSGRPRGVAFLIFAVVPNIERPPRPGIPTGPVYHSRRYRPPSEAVGRGLTELVHKSGQYEMRKLTIAQIGRSGEWRVQYRILKTRNELRSDDDKFRGSTLLPTRLATSGGHNSGEIKPASKGGRRKGPDGADCFIWRQALRIGRLVTRERPVWLFRHEELIKHAQQHATARRKQLNSTSMPPTNRNGQKLMLGTFRL